MKTKQHRTKMIILVAALATVAMLAIPSVAGAACVPGAEDLVAGAKATNRGTDWGPVPLWRIDLPSLHASVDVNAPDEAAARAAVAAYYHCTPEQVTAAATPPPPVVWTPPPPLDTNTEAGRLLANAPATNLGTSGEPAPRWRFDIPSLNLSCSALGNTADEARSGCAGTVTEALARKAAAAPTSPPAATPSAPPVATAVAAPPTTPTPPAPPVPAVPSTTPVIVAPAPATSPSVAFGQGEFALPGAIGNMLATVTVGRTSTVTTKVVAAKPTAKPKAKTKKVTVKPTAKTARGFAAHVFS